MTSGDPEAGESGDPEAGESGKSGGRIVDDSLKGLSEETETEEEELPQLASVVSRQFNTNTGLHP